MLKLLIAIASTFKGRQITVAYDVSTQYLFLLFFRKFLALVRGIVFCRKYLLLGPYISISHKKQFFAASGVEIKSGCIIDCLSEVGLTLGSGVSIGHYCIIKCSGSLHDLGYGITIGENVGIGDFSHIGGAGGVDIGADTITGAYLSIHPENHIFDDCSRPVRLQGVRRKGIKIGSGCWIGAKVTFLDGSSVGDGCVIAAGAVVTKSFPNRVVLAGVPARIIKRLGV